MPFSQPVSHDRLAVARADVIDQHPDLHPSRLRAFQRLKKFVAGPIAIETITTSR
jgi:hypothetical protein